MLMLEDKLMNIDEDFDISENEEIGFMDYGTYDTIVERIDGDLRRNLENRFDSYEIETGATKAVIIPKNYDYVIKIPFNGQWDEDAADYDYEAGEYTEDFPFVYFQSGDNQYNHWDYCAREAEIYEEAVRGGVSEFFAATTFWKNTYGNYPMYLQEKCRMYSNNTPTEKSITKAQDIVNNEDTCIQCVSWIANFIDFYGLEEYRRLTEWLSKEDNYGLINDLVMRNLGYRYRDNAPVIVDYSGYWEA